MIGAVIVQIKYSLFDKFHITEKHLFYTMTYLFMIVWLNKSFQNEPMKFEPLSHQSAIILSVALGLVAIINIYKKLRP